MGAGSGPPLELIFRMIPGVSASAERTQMCSGHRPGTRGPQSRDHPRRITTSKPLEGSQMH